MVDFENSYIPAFNPNTGIRCPDEIVFFDYVTQLGVIKSNQNNGTWYLSMYFYNTNHQSAQKTKFSIKDFFSKCDEICRKPRI